MWATVIMTMALETAIPIVMGVLADSKLGTKYLFLILGIFLSFCAMIVNFIKLMKLKWLRKTVNANKTANQDKTGK